MYPFTKFQPNSLFLLSNDRILSNIDIFRANFSAVSNLTPKSPWNHSKRPSHERKWIPSPELLGFTHYFSLPFLIYFCFSFKAFLALPQQLDRKNWYIKISEKWSNFISKNLLNDFWVASGGFGGGWQRHNVYPWEIELKTLDKMLGQLLFERIFEKMVPFLRFSASS